MMIELNTLHAGRLKKKTFTKLQKRIISNLPLYNVDYLFQLLVRFKLFETEKNNRIIRRAKYLLGDNRGAVVKSC